MAYTVWSKSKHGAWVVERSFELKSYAQQVANAINKVTDRRAKILPKGKTIIEF